MPICNCTVARCGARGGRSVDARTLKNHARADESRRQADHKAYQQAINDQDERIATHLAALSLSDDSTSFDSQSLSGNRMWRGEVESSREDIFTGIQGTCRQPTISRLERVTQRLHELDSATDVVREEVTQLLTNKCDGSTKPSISIKDLLARLKELDDDFQRSVVRDLKRDEIVDLQESIRHKLSDAHAIIRSTLESRKAAKQTCRHPDHPSNPPIYQSGTVTISLTSSAC